MGRTTILAGCLILALAALPAWAGNCLEGDCADGSGTYQWNDGSRFTGSFVRGTPDGEGMFTDPDGNEYHVIYKDGRPVQTVPVTKEERELKARRAEADRYNEAGLACLRRQDYVSAIGFFNKAITLWPENPAYNHNYLLAKGHGVLPK